MPKRPHQAQSVTTHESHDRVAEDTTRMSSPLPALLRDYDDPCKMTDAKMTFLSRLSSFFVHANTEQHHVDQDSRRHCRIGPCTSNGLRLLDTVLARCSTCLAVSSMIF